MKIQVVKVYKITNSKSAYSSVYAAKPGEKIEDAGSEASYGEFIIPAELELKEINDCMQKAPIGTLNAVKIFKQAVRSRKIIRLFKQSVNISSLTILDDFGTAVYFEYTKYTGENISPKFYFKLDLYGGDAHLQMFKPEDNNNDIVSLCRSRMPIDLDGCTTPEEVHSVIMNKVLEAINSPEEGDNHEESTAESMYSNYSNPQLLNEMNMFGPEKALGLEKTHEQKKEFELTNYFDD